MSIPKFDKKGNIPIGDLFTVGATRNPLIFTTLPDIHQRFVAEFPRSRTRSQIWDGWMKYRSELTAVGLTYTTLIGGSFITAKADPRDVDFAIILDSKDVDDLSTADPAAKRELDRLVDTRQTKGPYLCDAYPIMLRPLSSPRFFLVAWDFNYWTRVFGIDRPGNQRAVLYLDGGGVL